jgi:hypothetical protein
MLTSFTKNRGNEIIWLKAGIWKLWGTRRGYENGRWEDALYVWGIRL